MIYLRYIKYMMVDRNNSYCDRLTFKYIMMMKKKYNVDILKLLNHKLRDLKIEYKRRNICK